MVMNCKTSPLISIVTVCYNSAKTIENTLNSVLNQTYDNYEYWVIDGGSSDGTLDILERVSSSFNGRLHYISEKDSGIFNAMNKGIKKCNGDIIGLLNSDDSYDSQTLSIVAKKYVAENHKYLIIIGDLMRVSSKGERIYKYHFSQDLVEKKLCFGHPSMFAAKSVYDKIGLYDESYKLASDGDWQLRAMEDQNIKVVLSPYVFNYMREGGASDSFKNRWRWFYERVRMMKTHHRGNIIKNILMEFKKVLVTDLKYLLPTKWASKAYKLKYKND